MGESKVQGLSATNFFILSTNLTTEGVRNINIGMPKKNLILSCILDTLRS